MGMSRARSSWGSSCVLLVALLRLLDFELNAFSFQELGPLPSLFVLASISSFSWHVSSVFATSLGMSDARCSNDATSCTDHVVRAGRCVSRSYSMPSLAKILSVSVPCLVRHRFSNFIHVAGYQHAFTNKQEALSHSIESSSTHSLFFSPPMPRLILTCTL